MQTYFRITNLSCEACVKLSTSALCDIVGVKDININLQTGDSFVEADGPIPFEKVQSALKEVGKEAEPIFK